MARCVLCDGGFELGECVVCVAAVTCFTAVCAEAAFCGGMANVVRAYTQF